ncbi:ATP-dependent RNA helicase DHX30 isoform X1 [Osmia lignaria lignaria]|uniref:ATP-dependent RNA helicase DHX30 isoform X1 n=1 Tax=Osmia lignaria lignaria TaxID=1437193 RepID=UPI00402B1264
MFLSQITSSSRMTINSFLVSLSMKQICRSHIKEFHKHQKAMYSVFNGQSKADVDPDKFGEINKCDNKKVNQYEQKYEDSDSNILHFESSRKSLSSNYISDIKKLHPHPLSSLMNIYTIVDNEFQKNCITVSYKDNGNTNMCHITITWPRNMIFASDASKKKQAGHNAALKCLQWLYENNYIKEQRPVLYSTKQLKELLLESTNPIPINIESELKNEIKVLIKTFEDDIKSVITKSPGIDIENPDLEEVSTIKVSSSVSAEFNATLTKMLKERKDKITKLPIHDYREEILNSLQHNQVVLIKGDTGCGKSTQIPQFIMDAYTEQNKANECNIIVSQPRKVAAISLADRVASERYERVGDIVGYHVRFDNKLPQLPGSIVFYTTGVLLRVLETNPTLKGISHVIMDEVHERSLQSDVLLKLLKDILKNNPSIKLILMSATIDVNLFKQYFSCEVIDIPGRTYPVKTYFKEDIEIFKNNDERQRTEVPFDKIVELVQWITRNKPPGNILCFLPGWQEIKHVHKLLKERNINLLILPLHSKVPFEIQQKAFEPVSGKIILATDVAESSITIKDISYVIDSAIKKEKKWYKGDSVPVLQANLISKSNLHQRKGRAGRVGPGESYHLITKEEYDSLDLHPEPEILRTPLEEAIIISRKLSNENIFDFFDSMLNVPDFETLFHARDNLKKLGILDDNENLTSLGKRVSHFSLDPRLSKAIILSCVFQCLRPILLLTSLPLGESSVLSLSEGSNEKSAVKTNKLEFHKTSDHIAMIKYFDYWKSCNEEPGDIYIPSFFHMVKKLYALHMTELKSSGMLQSSNTEFANTCCDNNELIRATLFAATNYVLKRSAYGFRRRFFVKKESFTSEDGRSVVLTSTSVNYKKQNWPSNILTYVRKMKFARGHTVFETSMLTPLSVLLFSHNDVRCWERKASLPFTRTNEVVIRINNIENVKFCSDKETAELLLSLRDILWKVVNYIIDNEGGDLNQDNLIMVKSYKKELIDFIANMLQEAATDIDCTN